MCVLHSHNGIRCYTIAFYYLYLSFPLTMRDMYLKPLVMDHGSG